MNRPTTFGGEDAAKRRPERLLVLSAYRTPHQAVQSSLAGAPNPKTGAPAPRKQQRPRGFSTRALARGVLALALLFQAFELAAAALPDLAPLGPQLPNPLIAPPRPQVSIIYGTTNQGTASASASYWYNDLYLSTQPVLDPSAVYVASEVDFDLGPGEGHWTTNTVRLPLIQSGPFYLHLKIDAGNFMTESDENNNAVSAGFLFESTPADLVPVALTVPAALSGPAYSPVTIAWAVTNQGIGPAIGYWEDAVYLSTNNALDGNALYIGSVGGSGPVPVGNTYWSSNTWRLPMLSSGTYYVFVVADAGNTLWETISNNNTRVASIVFEAQPPDLAPVALVAPASLTAPPNPTISVAWGVTNQGAGQAWGNYSWADQLFLSTTGEPLGATVLASPYEYGPVAAGASYWRTNVLQLPVVQSGTYYLVFKADVFNSLFESDTNNNTFVWPIDITITPADLLPVAFDVPSVLDGPPNPQVALAWGVTNQGVGAALGYWQDAVYFSSVPNWDFSAVSLVSDFHWSPVDPGNFYTFTNSVRLPVIQSGNYYLIFRTDTYDNVHESDENNNSLSVPITFNAHPPDLSPVALLGPGSVTAPPYPTVKLVWGVTNQGTGEALGNYSWPDQVYVATNSDGSDATPVQSFSETGPVAPGASYWRTNFVSLPITHSGTYYLVFKTDYDNSLYEAELGNNSSTLALTVNVTPADLAPVAFRVPAVLDGPAYPLVTFVWGETNQGTGAALDSWYDRGYVSSSPGLDSANPIFQQERYGPLSPGGVFQQTNTVRLPLVSGGNYYFLFQADAYRNVYESDEANNLLVVPVTFNLRPPDLAPLALIVPATVTAPPNPTVTLAWGVTNQGAGEARGNDYWSDFLYFSTNINLSRQTLLLSTSEAGPVAAEGYYWRTNSVQLPVTRSGTYYLVFKVDPDNRLRESDTNNNTLVVPITLNITPADLVPVGLQVPAVLDGPPHPQLTLVWGTTNQGVGAALGPWSDSIFLSTNAFPDAAALWVDWEAVAGPLEPQGLLIHSNVLRLPLTQSGNYYLLFQSDHDNVVFESNENNNLLALPITFNAQPPDLAPLVLSFPGALTALPYPTLNITWAVTNQGSGEARGGYPPDYLWSDALYLNTSNSAEGGTLLRSSTEAGPVPAGGSYWRTNSVVLPINQSGFYYLVFETDVNNPLLESRTDNNTLSVPLQVTITPPDLLPVSFQAPSGITSPPLPTVTFSWGVVNQGTGDAGSGTPWTDQILMSTNSVLDSSAVVVTKFYEYGPISPAADYWRTNNLTLPVTRSGTYYFFFETDSENSLHEWNTSNNIAGTRVTFNIQPADLVASAFPVGGFVSGPPNPKLLFSWSITNLGVGEATGQWMDHVYFSTKSNLDSTATELLVSYQGGPLAPGAGYTRARSAIVPVNQDGQYYFILQADTGNSLYESNTVNNILVAPVTFALNPPDLSPVLLQAPPSLTGPQYPAVTLTYCVTNQGTGPAMGGDSTYNWNDQLYLSTHPVLDGSEIPIFDATWYELGPVAAARSYWRTRTVKLPVTSSGSFYLILRVNATGTLFESGFTNNVIAVPIVLNVQPPDLAPLALLAPTNVSGPPSPVVSLVWGITNQGLGPAVAQVPWTDQLYLSTDTNLDWPGTFLGSGYETEAVPVGAVYWRTNLSALPIKSNGTYYLVLRVDDGNDLLESNENNNVAVLPFHFQLSYPDLAPLLVEAPRVYTNAANSFLTVVTAVTNRGPGTAQALPFNPWTDYVFLSKSPTLDDTKILLASSYESGPVPAGGTYRRTNTAFLPLRESGDFFLIFDVNGEQSAAESDFTNNALAVPFSFQFAPPDLAPVFFQGPATMDDSGYPAVTLVWGITNRGPGEAWAGWFGWQDAVYISTNNDLSGRVSYADAWSASETNHVAAGSSYWRTNTFRLPLTSSGSFYLVLAIDAYNRLGETNRANNLASIPVSFTIHQPDLTPVALQAPTNVVGPPRPVLSLVWGITNQGTGSAQGPYHWYDGLYISTKPVLDDSVVPVWVEEQTNAVPAGSSYWRTNQVTLPIVQSGSYYLLLVANTYAYLDESDRGNNLLVVPVNFTVQMPDLATVAWFVPGSVSGTPWPSVTIIAGVTNRGVGPAVGGPGWADGVYLSTTPFLDESSYPRFSVLRTNPLPAGSSYWVTNTIQLPVIDSGTWYLFYQADAYSSVYEANKDNNAAMAAIDFELSPTPNLVPLQLIVPPLIGGVAPTVPLAWNVANQGPGLLAGQWSDSVFLSSSPHLEWYASPLLTVPLTNALLPGAAYWRTNSLTLPAVAGGNYYFILSANANGSVFETDSEDNMLAVPVRIDATPPPPVLGSGALLSGGAFTVAVSGPIGAQYVLQASTNLLSWVAISNFTMVSSPTLVADPDAASFQRRFYRVASAVPQGPAPLLSITSTSTNSMVVSWPLPADGWVLEGSSSLSGDASSWTPIPLPYPGSPAEARVLVNSTQHPSFYRLRYQP